MHRANVRAPPTTSIAAYTVETRQAGVRRTVAAVILIACNLARQPSVKL